MSCLLWGECGGCGADNQLCGEVTFHEFRQSGSISCTAGAVVIVGYGFAEVKPKTCTGDAYTYTATRAEKNYEIKLTAKSGEITDVKKVN